MEVLREPPHAGSFIPLAEHQSTTPASFYSGPPVLHYHSDRSKVVILDREVSNAPAFAPLFQNAHVAQTASNGDAQTNGDSDTQKVAEEVDVWVTSESGSLPNNDSLLLTGLTASSFYTQLLQQQESLSPIRLSHCMRSKPCRLQVRRAPSKVSTCNSSFPPTTLPLKMPSPTHSR